MLHQIILVLNTVIGLGGAVFALVAWVRPAALNPTATADHFYPAMYAVRAIPLGMLAVLAPFLNGGPAAPAILWAAAFSQLGDAGLGLHRRIWGMCGGGIVAAGVHSAAALMLSG
ncbi:hypothetical protein [Arachnia propionica]|uniref:hypothetical protein n=1 Tax=Arachnia propionica TaxID=1750 RepID=UPI00163B458A|nr:hypothetical protein [Arachnia propionica]